MEHTGPCGPGRMPRSLVAGEKLYRGNNFDEFLCDECAAAILAAIFEYRSF